MNFVRFLLHLVTSLLSQATEEERWRTFPVSVTEKDPDDQGAVAGPAGEANLDGEVQLPADEEVVE